MVEVLKTTTNVLFTEHDLRFVPEATLAKIVTLMWAETDSVGWQFLGQLMFIEPIHTVNGKQMVQTPRSDAWSSVKEFHHITSIMLGFADIVEELFHPTIITKEAVLLLHAKFKRDFDRLAGLIVIGEVFRTFYIRAQEYAAEVKQVVSKNDFNTPITPFQQLTRKAEAIYVQALNHALNVCHTRAPRAAGGGGETIVGTRSESKEGIVA